MTEEKKGRDDGFMQGDGSLRPIREVINERRKNAGKYSKQLREAAFRERAGMQAALIMCECCYPLVKCDTESGHEPWCPGEGYLQSRKRADAQRADPTLDPAMVDIEYTLATCPRCGEKVPDHDGFGVLAHLKPAHANGCGYCTHPSRDLVPGKGWVCGICELVVESDSVAPPIAVDVQKHLAKEPNKATIEIHNLAAPSVEYPSAHELPGLLGDAAVVGAINEGMAATTPAALTVAAIVARGDREEMTKAFLATDPRTREHKVLLDALATNRPREFVPWPDDKPPQYNGSGEPCDMWTGPCSCGATHTEGK